MSRKGYADLKVWQKSHKFAIEVYKLTKQFPKEELYGLTSQMRRSSLSIPTNIVEGHASSSKKEFLNFLNIANRSLVEVEYLLEFSLELGFIEKQEYNHLEEMRKEVAVILFAFRKSVQAIRNSSRS